MAIIRTHKCLAIITLISLVITWDIQAIIKRHDLTDIEYLQDETANAAIVRWSGCTSTLIAERWVITASHCVLGYDGNGRQTDSFIDILGRRYQLQGNPITHPEYVSVNNSGYAERIHDIALLHLQQAVIDVEPINLYELDDEYGQLIEIWGYGKTGDGEIGETEFIDGLRRGSNIISKVTSHELFMRFINPNSGNATLYEGHIGNGDSGGPAILRIDGEPYVAGLGATASAVLAAMFHYGSDSVYERVSSNLSWIKLQMGDDYPGSYNGPLYQAPAPMQMNSNDSGGGTISIILWLLLCSVLFIRRITTE